MYSSDYSPLITVRDGYKVVACCRPYLSVDQLMYYNNCYLLCRINITDSMLRLLAYRLSILDCQS